MFSLLKTQGDPLEGIVTLALLTIFVQKNQWRTQCKPKRRIQRTQTEAAHRPKGTGDERLRVPGNPLQDHHGGVLQEYHCRHEVTKENVSTKTSKKNRPREKAEADQDPVSLTDCAYETEKQRPMSPKKVKSSNKEANEGCCSKEGETKSEIEVNDTTSSSTKETNSQREMEVEKN